MWNCCCGWERKWSGEQQKKCQAAERNQVKLDTTDLFQEPGSMSVSFALAVLGNTETT